MQVYFASDKERSRLGPGWIQKEEKKWMNQLKPRPIGVYKREGRCGDDEQDKVRNEPHTLHQFSGSIYDR